MKINRLLLLPLLLFALFMSACDSNDMDGDGESMVSLRLQPVFDGQNLLMNQTFTHNGTAIDFEHVRMYISEFTLIAEDGPDVTFTSDAVTVPAKDANDNDVTHTVTDKIVLAKHEMTDYTYMLGHAPAGRYTGVRFKVGIDGMTNRIDPTQVPSDHPLYKQTDANNHWNWSNGYIFFRVDGQVDTDGDDTPDTPIEVHLGSGNFLNEVSLSTDFELMEDGASDVHIMVDYHEILADVDFSDPAQRLCHTADNLPVAQKVSAQIDGAFMFHGLHDSEGDHMHDE